MSTRARSSKLKSCCQPAAGGWDSVGLQEAEIDIHIDKNYPPPSFYVIALQVRKSRKGEGH